MASSPGLNSDPRVKHIQRFENERSYGVKVILHNGIIYGDVKTPPSDGVTETLLDEMQAELLSNISAAS